MSDDFEALVMEAEKAARQMKGWDFSFVENRRHTDSHPWDYTEAVCSFLVGVTDMLDMDTGGGEVLLGLRDRATVWPDRVCATEGYHPNVAVASRNLKPIGVEVVECRTSKRLPFEDESFDLIINRHGDYREPELWRILRSSGMFVTQQIGFGAKVRFNEMFDGPDPAYNKVTFADVITRFDEAGFEIIDQREFRGRDIFDDIGAVVFVLTAAPWEIPGFSVDGYREQLLELHESIETNGPIDIGVSYTLLTVRKRG